MAPGRFKTPGSSRGCSVRPSTGIWLLALNTFIAFDFLPDPIKEKACWWLCFSMNTWLFSFKFASQWLSFKNYLVWFIHIFLENVKSVMKLVKTGKVRINTSFWEGTSVREQTFYLQKVKDPKVTLRILFWNLDEHSVQVWAQKIGAFLLAFFRKSCFVCNSMENGPFECAITSILKH